MTTAYTVILGQYDNLRAPRFNDPACRYVCFSDRPRKVAPWEQSGFPMQFGSDNHRNCRIVKCLPHLFFPESEVTVYMDGAFLPVIPVTQAVQVLGNADIALYAHPGGHTSYHDERNFYQKLHGFVPDHVEATYQRYVSEDLPVTGQFYAGGLVIRRNTPKVAEFNELWFQEYVRGSYNDQFGLYYALVKTGLNVAIIPGVATMDTKRFGYCLHAGSGCGDNQKYEAENASWNERFERIKQLCAV